MTGPLLRRAGNRRFGWFRQYNDFASHPKWRLVAKLTRVEVCRVLSIVTCLEIAANKALPRGSIAEFSIEECATALVLNPGMVKKVVHCLTKLGWIDRDYLVTWDERQPDKEDQTAAERQQKRRAKIRQQNQADFPESRVTSRTRPDQIKKGATEEVDIPKLGKTTAERLTWAEAQQRAKSQPPQGILPLLVNVKRGAA